LIAGHARRCRFGREEAVDDLGEHREASRHAQVNVDAQRAAARFLQSDDLIDEAYRQPTQLGQRIWAQ
jgi:hypothetical protein